MHGYAITNNGTLTVNGGEIIGGSGSAGSWSSGYIYGTGISNSGTLVINNGTYKGYYGISNYGNGTVTFNNGTITESAYGINNNGTLEIKGGTITESGYGISNSGTVEINRGTIVGRNYGIYNNSKTSILRINEGIITGINTDGISNYSGATIEINGGTITGKSAGISNSGMLTVIEGTIIGNENYGINNGSTGTIIIGENSEDAPSTKTPKITGVEYGVNNLGTFNFYDGIIKGKTSINGFIEDIPDDCTVIFSTEDDKEVATIGKGNRVAYVGDNETNAFDNLKSAIEACGTEKNKITLLKNIVITGKESLEIAESQDITINLNGKEIKSYAVENTITNKGALKITDSSDGIIKGFGENIIKNEENATFEIEKGTITSTTIRESISSHNYYMVSNSGILKITGGTITGAGEHSYGINNIEEGNVIVSGGIISTSNGIYNNSTGSVIVNGGTITTNLVRSQSCTSYGIYNSSTGNVIVDEAMIEIYAHSTASFYYGVGYGIYNHSTGEITVNKGTISVKSDRGSGINNNNKGKVTLGEVTIAGTITNSGILTINGGTVREITNTGTAEINGGNTTGRINNRESGELTIKGGKTSYIENVGTSSTVTMTGGEVTGGEITKYSCGIRNTSTGTITIGENGEDAPSTETPKITGGTYGVENSKGTFNFYDGIITGKEGKSISGIVSSIPEDYSVMNYKNGENEKYTVEAGKEIAVLEKVNVAHVTSINKDYTSLEKALEATSNEDRVTLLRDTTVKECLEISEGKNITLDLAGHEITSSSGIINNAGNLKIEDNGTGGKITTTDKVISNSGTLEITGGTITNRATSASINISNSGILSITAGTISATGAYSYGIYNFSTGTVEINGGTISVGSYGRGIHNNDGTVQINDGTVQGGKESYNGFQGYGIYSTGGTITIEGGTITGYYGITSAGELTINDGIIKGNITNSGELTINDGMINGSITNSGTAEINKGTISSNNYPVISNTGTLTINDGNITSTNTSSQVIVIYNNQGTLTINGGTIQGTNYARGIFNTGTLTIIGGTIIGGNSCYYPTDMASSHNGCGIYNNSTGAIEIKKGTISGYNGIVNTSTGAIEITKGSISGYNGIVNTSTGVITLGEKEDGEISAENPSITGEGYGIYNPQGTLNFYDGIIKGKISIDDCFINDIPDNCNVLLSTENDREVATIGTNGKIAYIGEDTTTLYDTLKSAVNACGEGEEEKTITIVKNNIITAKDIVEIGDNQNITINLNGKEIRFCTLENTITNNGTLKIKDSEEGGKITSIVTGSDKSIILNTGIFEIIGGTIEGRGRSSVGIKNSGTVTVTGGIINQLITNSTGISNSGTLIVNGGTVNVATENNRQGYGIINSGSLTVTGGEIKGNTAISNSNSGTVDITGGIISCSGYSCSAIRNDTSGEIEITKGEITGVMYNYNGTIIVNGGTINSKIENRAKLTITKGTISGIENFGTAEIKGGTIGYISNGNYSTRAGTMIITGGTITTGGNGNYGTLTITGGKISATADNASGIGNYGTLTVKGGEITGTKYGICNYTVYGQCRLTLGENGAGMPNTERPLITGGTNGVYNNNGGIFNFYDGRIVSTSTGEDGAISGAVTEIPEDYKIKYSEDLKTAILESTGSFDNAIEVNGIYYNSLETAIAIIANTTDKTGTIHINVDLPLDTTITIPEETNITIAIKRGKEVVYSNVDTAIINNGTLTITDFVAEDSTGPIATLKNEDGVVIENNGRLIIGDEGIVGEERNSPRIIGKQAVIGNEPERVSGSLVSTEPITANLMAFSTYVLTPSRDRDTLLREAETRYKPEEWTNEDVNATVDIDVIPMLNLYSAVDITYIETELSADIERAFEGSTLEDTQVTIGDVITYKVTITNPLQTSFQNVKIKGTLPNGLELVNILNGGEENETEMTWTIEELQPGETVEIELFSGEVQYSETKENIKNRAKIVFDIVGANDGISEKYTNELEHEYVSLDPVIENTIEKTVNANKVNEDGIAVLTREDGVVTYGITYNVSINDYEGNAVIKVVDTLPAGIDTTKSNLAGGNYDPETNTITWTETIEGINTFVDGEYLKEILKEITVVYVEQDVTEDLINSVEGSTTLTLTNPESTVTENAMADATLKQEYLASVEVTKVWDDNENEKEHRPESVTVDIADSNGVVVGTGELNEGNNWIYEEAGLPKYTDAGELIDYVVTERETNVGDLEYYEEGVITDAEEQTDEVTIYTFTVTNEYKTGETKVNSVITKTSATTEITSKDSPIDYTIGLNSVIRNYIGSGKVIIVDTLPYRIDVDKSSLNDGVYDDDAQTITWEEELPHINTFEAGESYRVNITKNISLVYIDIDLTAENLTNGVVGRIELDEANIIDEGEPETESSIDINIKGKLTVKYLDKNTESEVAEEDVIEEKVGTPYITTKKEIDGYVYVETVGDESGTITEEDIEVIYYYETKAPVVENTIEKTVSTGKVNEEGIAVLTKEDGVVTYGITYNASVKYYRGNATIKIVDVLPAGIDTIKSNLADGSYDPDTNTITWEEVVEDIDTYANGEYTDQIVKNITVVYVGQDVTEDLINSVEGSVNFADVEPESNEPATDTATVKQEYSAGVKVTKVWEDNENEKEHRPESVTVDIKVMPNDSTISEVLNAENNWTYEEAGLPKYTSTGEKITYIVTERETNEGDLEYYEEGVITDTEEQTDEETIYTFTITNTYKSSDTSLNTEVTKVANTTEITSKDDPVSYTIRLSSEINNYIGEGKVTIIDTLPYKIDLSKSDIAGGVYDDETGTITWIEEISHINTFTSGESYKIDITKQITVVYKDMNLAEEDLINSVYGKVELSETEEKDEGTPTAGVPISVKGKVIAKYINKNTGLELADPDEIEEKIGREYAVSPKTIAGYMCVETSGNETGTVTEEDIEVVFYYDIDTSMEADIIVTKVWDDDNNAKGHRPESVTIDIADSNGVVVATGVLSEENNWKYENTELPKYTDTRELIDYVVTERETNVGDLEYYEEGVITDTEERQGEETIYTFTITNTYKSSDTSVNTEVTKVANTTEITSKDDPISYTIRLSSEIKNYIGEGKVIIIDTLPYKIDLSKSDIAGGAYDDEAMTITWEEEISHINTYQSGGSYRVDITKQISVVYKDIDLTADSLVNSVRGRVILDDFDKEDEGNPETETPIKINVKGDLTVKFIEKDTNKKLAEDEVISEKVGSEYHTSSKVITGYDMIQVIGDESGVITEEAKTVTYVYEKVPTGKVTIKYQDKDGNTLDEDVVIEGKVGNEYIAFKKDISDYRFVEIKGSVSGIITTEPIEVIYVYEKIPNGMVTVKYVEIIKPSMNGSEPDTVKEILDPIIIEGYAGDKYETEAKGIQYYKLVKSTENISGELLEEGDTVVYYYEKLDFNMSMEKTISKVVLNGQEVGIEDNKLVKIEVPTNKLEKTELIVSYKIAVINSGEVKGKATVIEQIPEGYELVEGQLPDGAGQWVLNENGVLEAEVELNAGQRKELEVTLKWVNAERNLGTKINVAKITGTENIAKYDDTNKDDDIDTASVIVSIKTGEFVSIVIGILIMSSLGICGYIIVATVRSKGPDITRIKFLH